MKNNEYNIVKITNEKKNFSGEFTSSQSFEFSFQPENDDSFKDELNSKPVVNDKVEENLSKKAKEQEEKKKEKQDSQESENLGSSSSSASSASSANGASAAGAGASAGGAIASVAAAATVSVAAIGAIVGINVIGPAQQGDLINFLSSNVTSTSIEFEFSMNNDLLSYNERQGSDGPIGEKSVVYQIKDSNDFYKEEFIPFVETDYKYTASITGLIPNTGYALDIQIKEENPEIEVPTYQLLAHRTFVTPKEETPAGQLVQFLNVVPEINSVTYQFIVDNETANYNPDEPTTPALSMLLYAGDEFIEETWLEENDYQAYSETQLICSGSFRNLNSGTTYRIDVNVKVSEEEFEYLGHTTFTTKPAPETGFTWKLTTAAENTFTFRYYVDAAYVGYVEGSTTNPTLFADIVYKDTEETAVYDDEPTSASTYGSTLVVYDIVSGLTAATDFIINVGYLSGNDREILGTYEFTTTERTTGFRFDENAILITDSTILPRFYLKTIEIVEKSGGTETNINMTISGGMAYSETTNVKFRSAIEEGLSYSEDYTFEGLSPNMTYTINVTNTDTGEVYGSIDLTTDEQYNAIGFAFDSFERGVVSTEYNFSFHVNASFTTDPNLMSVEVIPASGGEPVYSGQISGGLSQDETLLECTGSITGLEEGVAYIAGIHYTSSPEWIGVYNFETDPNPYGFQFIQDRFVITSDSIEFAFYLNESVVQSVEGVIVSIMEVDGSEDLSRIEIEFGSSDIEGKLLGTGIFPELQASTEYIIKVYEKNGESTRYGRKTLTTTAPSTSSFNGLNDGATTFYCQVEPEPVDDYIYIPIKCQYNDLEEIYTDGFSLMFTLGSDPSVSFTATARAVNDYQYVKITDSGLINRLGSTFDINVYSQADVTKLIYTAYNITIKNAETDSFNYVYGGHILNTAIENYQGTAYLETEIISVYGNTNVPSGTQIKFAKGSDYSVYYTFDIPMQYGSVSIDMVTTLAESWDDRVFSYFSDVQNALSGESWDVIIIWNDGSGEQTKTIETGVTFSFNS